jgi:RND superfamily putative drug exporter
MWLDTYCRTIGRRTGLVILSFTAVALVIAGTAPDLTRLVASKPACLLPDEAESRQAQALINATWPDQAAVSKVVVVLERPAGLTARDRDYARELTERFGVLGSPATVLGAIGPGARPEVDSRLVSRDDRVQLVIVRLSELFVGPAVAEALAWLKAQVAEIPPPEGLAVAWSGDAVLGSAFMGGIRTTLDRAALVTVVLILAVLLIVYRSVWLALVPLLTIGLSLAVSRGLLAWLVQAGWEVSVLLELFLIVILFGSGTDFCLLLTWRFAERWDGDDSVVAMAATLRRVWEPLLTSAGTVMAGLLLMGTTRFALFSRTGPGVALGLAVTVLVCLTLTPALLMALARRRPHVFARLKARSASSVWRGVGRSVLARPAWVGAVVLATMAVPAALGLRTTIVYDLLAVLPGGSAVVRDFHSLANRFGPGAIAPLSVVLDSDEDLRRPGGLALIDDLSQSLAVGGGFARVRSMTRPTGDSALLDMARIAHRLDAIQAGLEQICRGADQLSHGLDEGAVKARLARGIGQIFHASGRFGPAADRRQPDLVATMIEGLDRGARGAGDLSKGSRRVSEALAAILEDPEHRVALNRLLITPADLTDHPELRTALAYYLSPDGRRARIELDPAAPVFSAEGIDGVEALRHRLAAELTTKTRGRVRALVGGANADWADVRAATRADQRWIWWAVPLGVALILLVALRDLAASLNLVATMLLTYLFALGTTYLVFIQGLGAPGIDWTVPYFLFILLVAVGVDYNVFLMARLREESRRHGFQQGIVRAVGLTGGLISSAAAITGCSFAAFLFSPLGSLRQLGFALVVGIIVDALLVRPVLVPCTHWLLHRRGRPTVVLSKSATVQSVSARPVPVG